MKFLITMTMLLLAFAAPLHAETDYVAMKAIQMLLDGSEGSYKGQEFAFKKLRTSGVGVTTSGIGAVANGVTATEYGDGVMHKTVLSLAEIPVVVVGATGVGFGGVKLYDFPEGRVLVLGVTVDSLIVTVGTGLDAADGGDWSFGTVISANATLDGTAVDLAPKTSADPINGANSVALAASAQFDGTTTAKDLTFSLIVDDGDIAGTVENTIAGAVTVTWMNLGDY